MPRRLPNGRFAKVTVFPDANAKPAPRQLGGGPYVQIRISGIQQTVGILKEQRTRVGSKILSDPDQRAARIQQRLRVEVGAAYTRATGRIARGIYAKVTKTGKPGDKVSSVIRVTMINYREARFLTNIGGRGHFKEFPVPAYRIFAKGAEGSLEFLTPFRKSNSLKSTRRTISLIKQFGAGRLKVPRKSSFFTAARQPGRGGGESKEVGDVLGPAEGDRSSHFFFYPLWVNHPGFRRDVISEVALDEGARFKTELPEAIGKAQQGGFVSRDIPLVKATFSGKSISVTRSSTPSASFRGTGKLLTSKQIR